MAATALITVVVGATFERFAVQMFASAAVHFAPTERVEVVQLPGVPGWPEATMLRPKILSGWLESDGFEFDFVYLIDADSRFEENVGAEVLPRDGQGITATLHPGYVGKPSDELPYERDPRSTCCVADGEGGQYFCGGFLGGDRLSVLSLMRLSAGLIERDLWAGHTPCWHDESSLNRILVDAPPSRILSPAYAHPDDGSGYRSWWPEEFERRIVMLDKSPAERASRNRR